MRHFLDTEFLEDGKTIQLISLGMVAEDDREFYAVNGDAPWDRIVGHGWLMENVIPSLLHEGAVHWYASGDTEHLVPDWDAGHVLSPAGIAAGVVDLIGNDPYAQLWAYYGAYDHIALCQLWGRMLDLPKHVPMWTHDLKQEMEYRGVSQLPSQTSGQHNALADARWNRDSFLWLQQQNPVIEL